jgi:hypothetical protein
MHEPTPTLPNDQALRTWWWNISPQLRERIEHHITAIHKLRSQAADPPIDRNRYIERKWIREQAGVNLSQAAKLVNEKLTHTAIQRWERGAAGISKDNAPNYAHALGQMANNAADEHAALAAANLWEADKGGVKIWTELPTSAAFIAWLQADDNRWAHFDLIA